MNALCELVIRIDPENRRIRLENNENGIVNYKEISPEALMDSFRQSIRTEGMMSGFLPPNCFHITVNPDKSKVYCLWYPELHADISVLPRHVKKVIGKKSFAKEHNIRFIKSIFKSIFLLK